MWNFDERYGIMYFGYRLKVNGKELKLFIYLFTNESFTGVEHIMNYPGSDSEEVKEVIRKYKKTAEAVIERRDRLKKLFEDF